MHCDPRGFTSSFTVIQSEKIWTGSGQQVDQTFYHHNRTGSFMCFCYTQGLYRVTQKRYKSYKRNGGPQTLDPVVSPLCTETEFNTFILGHQRWDLGLWMPSVKSQHSWKWNCNPMHAQSPVVSVLPLSGHWNVFNWNVGKRLMVQWQVLGMCSRLRSQSSVVSRPLGLWLSSLTGWATILSKSIQQLAVTIRSWIKNKHNSKRKNNNSSVFEVKAISAGLKP